jgi:hypothetical protein
MGRTPPLQSTRMQEIPCWSKIQVLCCAVLRVWWSDGTSHFTMSNLIPNRHLLCTHSPLDVVNVMNNVTKNCYKAPAVQKAFFEVRHDTPRPSHPTYLIQPYLIPPYLIPPF